MSTVTSPSQRRSIPREVARQFSSLKTGSVPITLLLAYVGVLLSSELLISRGARNAGFLLSLVLILIVLASALVFVDLSSEDGSQNRVWSLSPAISIVVVLLLPPLTRVINLGLALDSNNVFVLHFADLPLVFAATLLAIRATRLSFHSIGVALPASVWSWVATGIIGGAGAIAGWMLFELLEPAPLSTRTDLGTLATFGVLFLAGGAIEELLYRGVLRTALDRGFEPIIATMVGASIYTAMAVGYRSAPAVIIIWISAVLCDIAVRRTGSLLGVAIARGVCLVFLFVVLPLERAGLIG